LFNSGTNDTKNAIKLSIKKKRSSYLQKFIVKLKIKIDEGQNAILH